MKNIRTISFFVFLLSFILMFCGCDVKGDAVGSYRKIPVLIDAGETADIYPLLSQAVEREIITPRHETAYKLHPVDSARYAWLKNARTSIIVASLESPGPAGNLIRQSLTPDALKAIQSNMRWMVVKRNLWAGNQIIVFLTAPTTEALAVQLDLFGDDVFEAIDRSVNERVGEWLYGTAMGKGEQYELEDSIARAFGWGIRVPRYWSWEKGTGEDNFLWLRTLEPERWVFVWHTDMDTTIDYDIAWWRHVRDSLCEIYYEGDSVARHTSVRMEGARIGGRPAVEIRGLWENRLKHHGGPFVSYVLSDKVTRRVFIVDGAVFAPIVPKEPYLRHVEIVCKSFQPDLPKFYEERKTRED